MHPVMAGLATVLAAGTGPALQTIPAHASAEGGCPPGNGGFAVWDIATEPYGVDDAVDAKGNNDGWVCARPIHIVTDENGEPFQIYNFIDNHFK